MYGYLKGTTLLIDCLQLATVANRSEIEERLLLPANSIWANRAQIDH